MGMWREGWMTASSRSHGSRTSEQEHPGRASASTRRATSVGSTAPSTIGSGAEVGEAIEDFAGVRRILVTAQPLFPGSAQPPDEGEGPGLRNGDRGFEGGSGTGGLRWHCRVLLLRGLPSELRSSPRGSAEVTPARAPLFGGFPSTMPTDPVCGMFVEPGPDALMLARENRTYYFCSRTCQRTFAEPEHERVRLIVASPWPGPSRWSSSSSLTLPCSRARPSWRRGWRPSSSSTPGCPSIAARPTPFAIGPPTWTCSSPSGRAARSSTAWSWSSSPAASLRPPTSMRPPDRRPDPDRELPRAPHRFRRLCPRPPRGTPSPSDPGDALGVLLWIPSSEVLGGTPFESSRAADSRRMGSSDRAAPAWTSPS